MVARLFYKVNTMIKILKLLGLLSLMFIIPSCSNDEDNNTTSDTEENVFIGIDTDWDTEYPVALFNSTYGSIGMFSFDEDDKIICKNGKLNLKLLELIK